MQTYLHKHNVKYAYYSLSATPQKSRISYAYVIITKSAGSKQLSTQQFGFGRIYSTQHFWVELVSTYF